jgi:hypothetical protein
MEMISVHLDTVLVHYTKQRHLRIERETIGPDFTVRHLLQTLSIPDGMVGVIVGEGRLLEAADVIPVGGDVKMFGIYDGG